MKNCKALVYDSGIGGLAVLNKLVKAYPSIEFYYLSDSKNCPYGMKSVGELEKISSSLLSENNVTEFDFVVLACNTLSTNCLDFLSRKFKMPFLGVRPPINLSGSTLLLCTKATAESSFLKAQSKNLTVYACLGLVEDIENGILSIDKILIEKYKNFFPSGDYDNVILGCTHFIYLKPFLTGLYTDAHFYDGTEELLGLLNHRCGDFLGLATNYDHLEFMGENNFLGRDKRRNYELYYQLSPKLEH